MDSKPRLTTPATRRAVVTTGAKLASAAALAAAGVCSGTIGAEAITCDLIATLNGHNETDGEGNLDRGDPDGRGRACIDLRARKICWDIQTRNIGPVTAAHIHSGRRRQVGPPVVDFEGQLSGCKAVPNSIIEQIQADPAAFYVNVHTSEFPSGAIRGQLRRSPAA